MVRAKKIKPEVGDVLDVKELMQAELDDEEAQEDEEGMDNRVFQLLSALCKPNTFSGRVLCYCADQEDLEGIDKWISGVASDPVLTGNHNDTVSLLADALPGTLTILYLHEIPKGMSERMWHRLEDAVEQVGYFILQLATPELLLLPPWLLAGSMMIHTERTPDDDLGMWLFRIRAERR